MLRAGFRRRWLSALAAAALTAPMVLMTAVTATSAAAAPRTSASRPQGPCDLYALGGTPCAAAHSTTRALYASYDGPLYQVRRLSDGHLKGIGVVEPSARPFPDAGGYANAAAQDAFCADTTCLITKIYDQSPNHNDLTQAPRGNFTGPALGGANNLPIANAAPITVSGHKAYGVFIEPGMGLRDNDTKGIAVDDQPEGMYWLIDGHHFNDGCCFDYGNTEIDSKDDGNGTMETSYFGDSTGWYHGQPPGPWVMTDQENNLVGCVNPGSSSKLCPNLPSVTDRFVTAVAKGAPHHWATLDGNAQHGALSTLYDGPRVDASYDPMRKQGGIVLGNGGDNSNGSQGTFYEGVMTTGYPSDATDQAVQANIVATRYDVHRLSLTPAPATDTPPGLQTFTPGSGHKVTETFTNTSGSRAVGVTLSLARPSRQWASVVAGTHNRSKTFRTVAPGASVSATFTVTSGPVAFDGDLIGKAAWTDPSKDARQSETTTEKVRNVSPIKINELRISTTGNATDSFIELSNAGNRSVDLSNWTLDEHAIGQAHFSTITIPGGTKLEAGGHYLLGLGTSGLAIPTQAGDSTLYLRSATGLKPGDRVQIGGGRTAEVRTISAVNNTGATGPRVPGKIGNAVKLSGNGDYVALPGGIVGSLNDFTISAWVNPAAVTTWSRIFDFGNNTNQYMFLSVDGGGAGLRFAITTTGNGAEQQLTGGGQLPLNTWSHVAVTLSGNTGRLYLNGNLVATNANMTLHPSSLGSTTNDWIGRSQFPDPSLNATVDDLQIYDRALTATDVGSLAGGQAGAGNVASYKFDEASGETALDSSGQGHNATIVTDATAASSGTPLWQPEPDGPITVLAGSTHVPVTSTSGFGVGEKVAIGHGRTMDVATVTAVGKAGTQAALLAAAPAGTTVLRVSSTADITAGDRIRLDIGSRMETVTVATVGTAGSAGTGLVLTAPLKFSHSPNLPFTDRGTGVTFTPATRFAHVSNEPVRPLGSSVTLNKPLTRSHATDAAVVDAAVTNAGYQATPDQWFGGPALTSSGGSMVLANARGVVADSLNFGRLVDPWLAEGYQGTSGPGQGGCTVPVPPEDRSAARYPDGTDSDSNCSDFMVTSKPTPGATNRGVALDAGPLVSLHGTTVGDTASYIRHDDTDDLVVTSNVTAGSSATVKQDATFVEAAGLANPGCVSFESINRPGSYLRHFAFVMHLQPNDGSSGFAQDATFCPTSGNSGHGVSFQSANFPTKYIRAYQGGVYVASNGGSNAWDDTTGWAASSSWLQAPAWAQPPQGSGG
jgi:Alpha-L-arabinofuranosidase B, catalytic/Alpha-L-arabinofuranosidase B (ABFB) domain/Concanavalin A-like lectin/glucanases superfamily/Lamin Tail Domain/NPCBM-associated, NEW3 domain of alpha-galactosidase